MGTKPTKPNYWISFVGFVSFVPIVCFSRGPVQVRSPGTEYKRTSSSPARFCASELQPVPSPVTPVRTRPAAELNHDRYEHRPGPALRLPLLIRTPGFTAIAVAVLALGIGATVTVFSLANAFFLRPLPVSAVEDLVRVCSNRFSNTACGRSRVPRPQLYARRDWPASSSDRSGSGSIADRAHLRRNRQRRLLLDPGRLAPARGRVLSGHRTIAPAPLRWWCCRMPFGRADSADPPTPSAARLRSTISRSRSSASPRNGSPG